MVTTQKTNGKRHQTVLVPEPEPQSKFSDISNFDYPDYDGYEPEPQSLSDLDESDFGGFDSDGAEEDALQTEAGLEEQIGEFETEAGDDLAADSEFAVYDQADEAGVTEEDNYDDYIPEGYHFADASAFEVPDASSASSALTADDTTSSGDFQPDEFSSEFDALSEFADETSAAQLSENQFKDIDAYDYQPELETTDDNDDDGEGSDQDEEDGTDAESYLDDKEEDNSDLTETGYEAADEEEETEDFIDPRASKSKTPLTGNPLIKAAFVGASGLIVVMIGGSVYSLLSGGGSRVDPAAANLEEVTPEPEPNALPEEGRLRAELAFSSQQNDLERARRMNGPQPSPSSSPTAGASRPSPSLSSSSSSAPLPQALPLPQPLPIPGAGSATPMAPPPVDPYADLSPIERWQTIATLGSFGRANPAARSASPVAAAPAARPATPAPAMPVMAPVASPAAPATSLTATGLAQLRSSPATPGMRSAPLADVLVGTTATGSLATAVVLGADSPEAANPSSPTATKYLVNLSSPIKDAQGQTAIPAGAMLVVVVSGFSAQTGTMQLAVRSVIHNNREYQAPEGAILIRGEDGASLRASRIGGTNPIIGAVLPSILQGAATAAGTLTQNRGTTVTNGSVTTTTDSGEANIAAGFIQGAGQSLAQQISQATQNANAAAQSRLQSWRLSEGKTVQVFVNNTFQM